MIEGRYEPVYPYSVTPDSRVSGMIRAHATPRAMTAWVYILASKPRGTLYVGVTNDLLRRVAEHREGAVEGFTKQHGVKMLVYFEEHESIVAAIEREKRLKRWARSWKIDLIRSKNPDWRDLFEDISG